MSDIRLISTDDLEQRLEKEANLVFWNVLTDDYFDGELIEGSRHVPLDTVEQEVVNLNLPEAAEIILYCAGPSCPQSREAGKTLKARGYLNVSVYEGGLEAWKREGNPVQQAKSATSK